MSGAMEPAACRAAQELLEEYRSKKNLYERYCQAIGNMLSNLLEDRGYKHHLQWRVKEAESLRRKVERKQRAGMPPLALGDVDDVAGVRVILYLDGERRRFVREIRQELSGRIRIKNKKKASGYEATHLIVALGEKRLGLSEYRKFAGLKCEIQVTSILNHAWSEIEHDIFYKPFFEEAAGGDPQKFAGEKRQIKLILGRYIKKANSEFDKVIRSVHRRTAAARRGQAAGDGLRGALREERGGSARTDSPGAATASSSLRGTPAPRR